MIPIDTFRILLFFFNSIYVETLNIIGWYWPRRKGTEETTLIILATQLDNKLAHTTFTILRYPTYLLQSVVTFALKLLMLKFFDSISLHWLYIQNIYYSVSEFASTSLLKEFLIRTFITISNLAKYIPFSI